MFLQVYQKMNRKILQDEEAAASRPTPEPGRIHGATATPAGAFTVSPANFVFQQNISETTGQTLMKLSGINNQIKIYNSLILGVNLNKINYNIFINTVQCLLQQLMLSSCLSLKEFGLKLIISGFMLQNFIAVQKLNLLGTN